jgi:hypothetical protein
MPFARWPTAQSQPTSAEDKGKNCRSYAASFSDVAARRSQPRQRREGLAALDSVIDAFDDLLATKCGG